MSGRRLVRPLLVLAGVAMVVLLAVVRFAFADGDDDGAEPFGDNP